MRTGLRQSEGQINRRTNWQHLIQTDGQTQQGDRRSLSQDGSAFHPLWVITQRVLRLLECVQNKYALCVPPTQSPVSLPALVFLRLFFSFVSVASLSPHVVPLTSVILIIHLPYIPSEITSPLLQNPSVPSISLSPSAVFHHFHISLWSSSFVHPGLLSVSYDEWDYGLDARVRDGVAIITMATSTMMMDRGPHTLLKSECHGAPEKKTPISGNPNEVLRWVAGLLCCWGRV